MQATQGYPLSPSIEEADGGISGAVGTWGPSRGGRADGLSSRRSLAADPPHEGPVSELATFGTDCVLRCIREVEGRGVKNPLFPQSLLSPSPVERSEPGMWLCMH
ncbi:unnamed protein product [Boreogadus saida]